MSRARYRDDMTPEQSAQLLAECDQLEACYAEADGADAQAAAAWEAAAGRPPDPEEIDAAYEQSMDFLNKIAGDR